MAERTSGWRKIFSQPWAYRLAQRGIGSENVRRTLADEYLKPRTGDHVLDIGCGTGDIVEHLPVVNYVGFDPSEDYVQAARERFGDRATFTVGGVGDADFEAGAFDLCVAKGVLHHLDDRLAEQLFIDARRALKPGGRVVTIDPMIDPGQSSIAKFLAERDRGQNVRASARYGEIAEQVFDAVVVHVHHDLLHVPYSHAVVVATAQ